MSRATLEDRVAVVTGASSGIGAATARALVDAGVAVVLAARSEDDRRGLAADLENAGGTASVVPTDVTDEGEPPPSWRRPSRRTAGWTRS